MRTSDRPTAGDHPQALLLPYLEDRISQQERSRIEEHLLDCGECSTELQALENIISSVRTNKEAFCPEPWQLHEFVETGVDPHGRLRDHLKSCRLCSEEVSAYSSSAMTTRMPAKLREAFDDSFPQASGSRLYGQLRASLAEFMYRLSEMTRVPALAVGTVAATVLLLVVFYPRQSIQPFFGLSSVTWDREAANLSPNTELVPKSGLFDQKKPRMAMLIAFRDFKQPWPQEKINSLYEALQPTPQLDEQFENISPSELSDFVTRSNITPGDRKRLLEKIRTELDVSRVLILEVFPKRNQFRIHCELVNPESGKIIRARTDEAASEDELPRKFTENLKYLTDPN